MKTVVSLIGAIALMMFSAIPASSAELTAGVYQTKFFGGCGVLTVKSGGKRVSYKFGPCGGSATYSSGGSFDGQVIKIQAARLKVSGASDKAITGQWSLRGNTVNTTFRKVR